LPVFAAVHAVPLRLRGNAIGALNLFCHQPATIPDDALALGQALADVATIAILQERAIRRAEVLNEQLQGALNSRVVIEQAKGVLARHSGLDMEQVFNLMRRYARNHNQQLSTIARALAERTLDPNTLIPTNPTPRQPTPDTG
nr:ANTAR domain-containing protein [Actinomycetota bacterium]